MKQKFSQGFTLAEGFDFAQHQQVALISIGVPLAHYATASALLLHHGWQELSSHRERVMNLDRVYDWIFIEAFMAANKPVHESTVNFATAVANAPGIPAYNITMVNLGTRTLIGTPIVHYSDGNKNYFEIPADGRLPFGIDSDTPDLYNFVGLSANGIGERKAVISLHTSPDTPLISNLYPVEDLAIRTSAVIYLAPTTVDGDWLASDTGAGILCLADKENVTGFTVNDPTVQILLSYRKEYQFMIALVAAAWIRKYGTLSADMFKAIAVNPISSAGRIDYDVLSVMDHFNK